MKRVYMFLAAFLVVSMGFSSHPNASELNLRLADGSVFDVMVNDRVFAHRQTSYTISDLRPGRQFVEVVQYPRFFNGRFFIDGPPRVVFSGYIVLPARTSISGFIDFNGRFIETQRFALRGRGNMPNRGRDHRFDREDDFRFRPMHPRDFVRLEHVLADIPFEGRRLEAVIHTLRDNRLSSEQLRRLLNLFSFERNRLELAKTAYPNLVDSQNFFIVYDAFAFQSSIRELNRFIAGF